VEAMPFCGTFAQEASPVLLRSSLPGVTCFVNSSPGPPRRGKSVPLQPNIKEHYIGTPAAGSLSSSALRTRSWHDSWPGSPAIDEPVEAAWALMRGEYLRQQSAWESEARSLRRHVDLARHQGKVASLRSKVDFALAAHEFNPRGALEALEASLEADFMSESLAFAVKSVMQAMCVAEDEPIVETFGLASGSPSPWTGTKSSPGSGSSGRCRSWEAPPRLSGSGGRLEELAASLASSPAKVFEVTPEAWAKRGRGHREVTLAGPEVTPTRRTLFKAMDAVGKATPQAVVDKSMPSSSAWMLPSKGGIRSPQSQLPTSQDAWRSHSLLLSATPGRTRSVDSDGGGCGRDASPLLLRARSWYSTASAASKSTGCSTANRGRGATSSRLRYADGEKTHPTSRFDLRSPAMVHTPGLSTPPSAGTLLQASPCCGFASPGSEAEVSAALRKELFSVPAARRPAPPPIPPLPFCEPLQAAQPPRTVGILPASIASVVADSFDLSGPSCGSSFLQTGSWATPGAGSPTHSDIEAALDAMPTPPRPSPPPRFCVTQDAAASSAGSRLRSKAAFTATEGAALPERRPPSSLASARDRFKRSVGALARSKEFGSARLRELDAMNSSPGSCR